MIYDTLVTDVAGTLILAADEKGLRHLNFTNGKHPVAVGRNWRRDAGHFSRLKRQLEEYFARSRRAFDVDLAVEGTPFQMQVWAALREIPYGRVVSYQWVADRIGRPAAVRAVGAANGRNPLPIVVPCHRVIGSDGSLTGYGGGLWRKNRWVNEDGNIRGVDLNRNNTPFWATNSTRSSPDLSSIVHHGSAPASEPEIQALDAAAQLGPIGRLRLYTDVHSFSQVHFWVRNSNTRLANQTERVLSTFTNHHLAFPAAKWYAYAGSDSVALNQGIGSTDEYFTHIYQVPSWTLEIEPRGGFGQHGIDYGGLGRNEPPPRCGA